MTRHVRRTWSTFFEYNGHGPWKCYESTCDKLVTRIGQGRWDGNIHHIDENKENDAPDNLAVMHTLCHQRIHEKTPELRQRISAKLKGRPSPTAGMHFPNHWTKYDDAGFLKRHRQINAHATTVTNLRGENNPFYGKKHTIDTRERMSQPRQRIICNDCNQEWAVNWIDRHKKDGVCARRISGKLPKTTCNDCGKLYAQRWMQRHKREGKCIKP